MDEYGYLGSDAFMPSSDQLLCYRGHRTAAGLFSTAPALRAALRTVRHAPHSSRFFHFGSNIFAIEPFEGGAFRRLDIIIAGGSSKHAPCAGRVDWWQDTLRVLSDLNFIEAIELTAAFPLRHAYSRPLACQKTLRVFTRPDTFDDWLRDLRGWFGYSWEAERTTPGRVLLLKPINDEVGP
jgi:hypothetical protein